LCNEVELDRIDAKIIKALLKDARTSLKDIAKECELSSNAIHKRICNLESSGVIAGSATLFNPRMFGFGFTVIMEISVNNENKNDLVRFVREHPDVLMCIEGIGVCDVIAIITVKSVNEWDHVKEEIRRQAGVKRVATIIMIDEIQFLFENLDISGDMGDE
jgi:Lrp/AsnC family transcriptional regulator for asnA, asnC and gidA